MISTLLTKIYAVNIDIWVDLIVLISIFIFFNEGINIKALTPIDEHAKLLTQWIEHGVFDALQKKFV